MGDSCVPIMTANLHKDIILMPIVKNIELFWVNIDPERPNHYQNNKDNPGTWNVQLRTRDKKLVDSLKKEFGFKFTPEEVDGALVYKTSVSTYAYDQEGNLNKPVQLIAGDKTDLNPREIGNGSVGNVRFTYNPDKKTRRLSGIQVTKLVKFTPREEEDFDEDDFEVVEDDSAKNTEKEDF